MRLWQNHGAVSYALIKHSSFFVALALCCSHRNSEQAAAKLQQSCQPDRKSQYISVTRQQGPSSSQARDLGAVEPFSFQSLCPERTLGSKSFLEQLLFIFLFVYAKTGGLNLFTICNQAGKRMKSNFWLCNWLQNLLKHIVSYVSPSSLPTPSLPPFLPSFLPSFLPPPFLSFSLSLSLFP